jgi:hypothetical protein
MERYEELRALACSTVRHHSREWELLVGSGLATWMKAWSGLTEPSVRRPSAAAGVALVCACSEVVTVLADMAMSAAEEVLA